MASYDDDKRSSLPGHEVESASYEKHSSSNAESQSVESEYPDGGRDAVLTLIGAILISLAEWGVTSIVGVLLAQYSIDQLKGVSSSKISWIITFQLFMTFFPGAMVGRLFDTVGPTPLIASGAVLMTFGLMMLSLCTEYYQFFLCQGVAVGLGQALMYGPANNCVAHWYKRKLGTMMGIVTGAAAVGSIVFPIALNNLILAVGFKWAIRIFGFIVFAISLPPLFLLKTRLPPRPFQGWQAFIDLGGLRDIRYVLFEVACVFIALAIDNPLVFAQIFAIARGYSQGITTYIVAIANGGCLIGRIIIGLLSDRFGPLNIMAASITLSAVVAFCWLAVDSPAGLVVWACVYGMTSSAFIALAAPCVAILTPNMSRFGGYSGLSAALSSFASLVSSPIAGALLDQDAGKFTHMIIWSGVITFGGAGFMWAARFAVERQKSKC